MHSKHLKTVNNFINVDSKIRWRPTLFRNTSLAKARNSLGPSPQLLPPTWWHHVGPDTCATFRCERPWSTDPWVPLGSGPISWANDLQATSDIGGPWFFWRMCFVFLNYDLSWLRVWKLTIQDALGMILNDCGKTNWWLKMRLSLEQCSMAHGLLSLVPNSFQICQGAKARGRSAHLLIFSLDGNACHEKIATCPSSTLGVCSRCT